MYFAARPTPMPAYRRLRAFSFDPSLMRLDTAAINTLTYQVPWELVEPGPVGEYLEVLDYDPTVGQFYQPVDLDQAHLLAQEGLAPSESNPQFHQQMVYAVAMTTIHNFEQALGRRVQWAPQHKPRGGGYEAYVRRLRLYPHALRDANAYYSPLKKAVLFGYFNSAPADDTQQMPDSLVFTCLSHDIITHEVTHAILDGMYQLYNEATNPDVLAFHEAFSDIVALFQHFTFPEVLRHQIAKTRGDLAAQNLLGELAQQFGTAIGCYGSLRSAIGRRNEDTGQWEPQKPSSDDYRTQTEPHVRGSILVAAVFDAFLAIYRLRTADLMRLASGGTGVLAHGELHPDLVNRLALEAAKAARHVLTMCIRALDYCPPIDLTFGDYLRALITADADLVADDRFHYRLAFVDAFRRRGIYPQGIKNLSVESLQLPVRHVGGVRRRGNDYHNVVVELNERLRTYAADVQYQPDREQVDQLTRDFIDGRLKNIDSRYADSLHEFISRNFASSHEFTSLTGLIFLDAPEKLGVRRAKSGFGPSVQIQNLRLVNRVGPDGKRINHVVFYLLQRSGVVLEAGRVVGHYDLNAPPVLEPAGQYNYQQFRGGCTLILDLDTLTLKYSITKSLLDVEEWERSNERGARIDRARAERQYQFQHGGALRQQSAYAYYFGQQLSDLSEPFAFLHQA